MRVTKSPKEGFPLPTDYDTSARWDSGFSAWGLLLVKHTHIRMNLPTTPRNKSNTTAEVTARGRQPGESDQIKVKLFNSHSLDLCRNLISLLAFNMTKVLKVASEERNFPECCFFSVYSIQPAIHQIPLLPLGGVTFGEGADVSSSLHARDGVHSAGWLQGQTQSHLRFNLESPTPSKGLGLWEEGDITKSAPPCHPLIISYDVKINK